MLIFATQINDTLEVHAIAIAPAIYYAVASACVWFGVTIATDPEGQEAVADFFYSCTDSVKNFFIEASEYWVDGYNIIYEWERDSWQQIATDMAKYWGNYTSIDGKLIPEGSNSYIGWTDDSRFTFYYANVDNMTYQLPQGVMKVYDTVYPAHIPYNSYTDNLPATQRFGGYTLTSDDNFSYYYFLSQADVRSIKNSTFSIFKGNPISNSSIRSDVGTGGWNIDYNFITQDYVGMVSSFFTDGTYSYSLTRCSDNKYRFVDIDNSNHYYRDLVFDSNVEASTYYWDLLGFKTSADSQVDVYNPSAWDGSIFVNKDVLNSKFNDATNMEADSIQTVLPGSTEKLEEMQANPDLVTDVTASDVYASQIPAVESSEALWMTKFPFCLPWDLYKLITGMNVNAQAPVFDFVVLPADSFGLNNEEIIWTIDFSQFEEFVKIMRFFEGAAFILFLIMISRKLIGGE